MPRNGSFILGIKWKSQGLNELLLAASGPFLPVFWEHTSDLRLPLGDAVHEWLVVSLFSGLVFAVLLGASYYYYYYYYNYKQRLGRESVS